ncbi:MAG: hypothetical protein ABSH36_14015 [Solirubrobacteraceae bacterium]
MPLPAAPHFLLDQPYQKRDVLIRVGPEGANQGGRPPGLLLHWGQVHDEGVKGDAASGSQLAPLMASPGAARYERDKIGGHKEAASWIRRKAPSTHAEWDTTVDEAIVAQQLLGTAGLIVPTRLLAQADWPDGLQETLDAARRAAARHPTTDMSVNLILDERWIRDSRLRRTLLNQFTDLPEGIGAAVHIHWSAPDVPDRSASLEALRVVVSALAGDGRRVLLVEAGRLGWLAIAWGAWGFTAGLSGASWTRNTAVVRRAKGQPATRIARVFEPNLLQHVRQAVHTRLLGQSGYQPCPCGFCQRQAASGGWSHDLSGQHALYALSRLTEQVAAPTLQERRARIRIIVQNAINFEAGLSFRLTGDSRPMHLPEWLAQL